MSTEQKEPKIGARVTLTYPDGTVKEGTITDVDNNTIIIKCDDGTTQCIGG